MQTRWLIGVSFSLLIGCFGCVEPRVASIGRKLDGIGKALDDYGTTSVSSPILSDVRQMKREFAFDLKDTDADDYYRIARTDVHGGIGIFSQRGEDFRGGFQARVNLENLLTNQIRMNRFREDELDFRRRRAFQDSGVLMGLLLPLIDPSLALGPDVDAGDSTAHGDDGDTAPGSEGGGSSSGEGPAAGGGEKRDETPGNGTTTAPSKQEQKKRKLTREEENAARLRELSKALGAASTGISGATNRPDIPEFVHELPEFAKDLIPENDMAKLLLESEKFAKFRELLGTFSTSQPAVQNRSAIITAAGDTMVESIMRFLGHPVTDLNGAREFDDKVVLLGVSMVSVAPGRRTMRGYVADVSVTCRLKFRPVRPEVWKKIENSSEVLELQTAAVNYLSKTSDADWRARRTLLVEKATLMDQPQGAKRDERLKQIQSSLERMMPPPERVISEGAAFGDTETADIFQAVHDPESDEPTLVAWNGYMSHPVVSAASPMTDTQTLDLISSIREQQTFALKLAIILAGFGAEAEAQGIFKSIKRLEQDAQTRTPMNSVAAYSNAGGTFGYQIGPSLVGVSDFIPSQRVGGLLNALALLIAGDYVPGPDMVLNRQSFPVALFIGLNRADLHVRLARDRNTLRFYYVEPILEFEQTTRWIPMRPSRAELFPRHRPPIRESERVAWAWDVAQARKIAGDLNPDNENRGFREYVESRADALRSQALMARSFQTIPAELICKPMYDMQPVNGGSKGNSSSTLNIRDVPRGGGE